MNKPKNIGTAWETACVRYLQEHGFPTAERRALAGRYDVGDILVTIGVVASCKGGQMAETATWADINTWALEATHQRHNAKADHAVVLIKRPHIGAARMGETWAIMRHSWYGVPMILALSDWCRVMREDGHGESLEPILGGK